MGIKAAGEHQAYSKKIAQGQEKLWDVGKVFSSQEYGRALNVIGTHDAVTLDMGDTVGTATRIADNLALFQKEKLPSMFEYVPGSERSLVAMGLAAKKNDTVQFEKLKGILEHKIDKTERLNDNLKRDLKAGVKEISFMTPKFTMGVLAGEVKTIGSSKDSLVSVTIQYNKFDATLQKMLDMGQRQTRKFLKDYGETDFSKTTYRLGDFKGKAILELNVEGVPKK